jgi:ABC-type multidrug transport system ATPase subunit/tRNA A-37 threonylcarbamoyl transferase component Bud32
MTTRPPGDDITRDSLGPAFGPGTRISNRYAIEELLGVGAFGRVYRARDEMLGRTVAVKTLIIEKRDRSDGRDAVTSFLEEARTIAKLDHPHIVPVHDAGNENGVPWMAMRLVNGESLDATVRKEGALPFERARRLLIQAAKALDHAHRKGVVHRDIKPSNMLLERGDDGSEHLWVADFGIARILTERTTTSNAGIAGTPSYMSPEQITGKKVDARADIFALGCVAYELAMGKRAFQGENLSQVVYKLVHEAPDGMAELAERMGKGFETVVRRSLAKSPEDRFQTAEEVIRALEALETDKAASPRKPFKERLQSLLWRESPGNWDGRNAIVVADLVKSYGLRKRILNGLSLSVPTGSIYALLGRNGSGKTTLIRTILGLYRQDSGRVSVFGRNPHIDGPAILSRVGYVPEVVAVFDWINVGQLIQMLRPIYKTWDHSYCYKILERFELPLDVKIRDMSRGMMTKVSLVAALAHRPELLVLDDPTLGLDKVVLREFFEMLAEVSKKEGTTVLIASHAIEQVEKIATHVGLISEGRLMLSDTQAGLKMRTREVRLTFRDDVPEIRNIDHFKTIKSSGRHLTGVVMDTSGGAMEKLKLLGAEEMEVRELDLDEIFFNFMK